MNLINYLLLLLLFQCNYSPICYSLFIKENAGPAIIRAGSIGGRINGDAQINLLNADASQQEIKYQTEYNRISPKPHLVGRFPPVGFHSSMCYSRAAFKHAEKLIQSLQKTKPLRGKSRSDSFDKPGLIDSKLVGNGIRATARALFTPDILRSHQFILQAAPKNHLMTDCFLSYGKSMYETSLNRVTVDSVEFQSGCTPFRDKAIVVGNFMKCINNQLSLGKIEQYTILKKLGLVIMNYDENEDEESLSYYISIEIAYILKVAPDYTWPVVSTCLDVLTIHSNSNEKRDIPLDLQTGILCAPSLTGAIGVLGHGIIGHEIEYLVETNTRSEHGYLKPKQVTKCDIHPTCSRLATLEILNFMKVKYSPFKPTVKTLDRVPSLQQCLSASETNCRFYSQCWIAAVHEVCAKHSFCCPDEAIHKACESNTKSSKCKRVCISR